MVDKAACECGCHAGKVGISAVSLTFCYGYLRKSHSLRKNISAVSGRRPECSARGDAFARHDDRYSLSRVFRSLIISEVNASRLTGSAREHLSMRENKIIPHPEVLV